MTTDRKALTRAYKETPRPMGVYRVHNRVADKSLVGVSVDLPSILNRELAQLRLGAHKNAALQDDWNALGPDAFVFEVLDTLSPPADDPGYDPRAELRVLEALWLEKLRPWGGRGYNAAPKLKG